MSLIGPAVRGALISFAVLFGTASAASAGFIFTAQERYVTGELGGNLGHAGPQKFSATDFGLFDRTTSLTIPTYGGGASASQRSQLLSDAITVAGQLGTGRPAMVGTGWASAASYTSVSFDLPTTTDVTLSASGRVSGFSMLGRRIYLTQPGSASIASWDDQGSGGLFPAGNISRSGNFTLPAGSYQLLVSMSSYDSAIAGSSYGTPEFNVALTIPEPGGASVVVFALAAAAAGRTRRRRAGI